MCLHCAIQAPFVTKVLMTTQVYSRDIVLPESPATSQLSRPLDALALEVFQLHLHHLLHFVWGFRWVNLFQAETITGRNVSKLMSPAILCCLRGVGVLGASSLGPEVVPVMEGLAVLDLQNLGEICCEYHRSSRQRLQRSWILSRKVVL